MIFVFLSFYSFVLFWLLFLSNGFVGFFLFDGWDKSHFMEKKKKKLRLWRPGAIYYVIL